MTERKQSTVWNYFTNTNITNCNVFKNVMCYNRNHTVLYKFLKTCNKDHSELQKGRQEEEGNPSSLPLLRDRGKQCPGSLYIVLKEI